jgi:hypothetical protein
MDNIEYWHNDPRGHHRSLRAQRADPCMVGVGLAPTLGRLVSL